MRTATEAQLNAGQPPPEITNHLMAFNYQPKARPRCIRA